MEFDDYDEFLLKVDIFVITKSGYKLLIKSLSPTYTYASKRPRT
jgi:hypothetical protein